MKHATRIDQVEALLDMVRVRERARTEADFNAGTAVILDALASLKFLPKELPRPSWALILEELLAEIVRGNYTYPYKFDKVGEEDVLLIRASHIMAHLLRSKWMRDRWDDIGIRTDRALKRNLQLGAVLVLDAKGEPRAFEAIRGYRRWGWLVAIRLPELRAAGIDTFAASQIACPDSKP